MENPKNLYKTLSDKSRLRILKMPQIESPCVCDISEILQRAACNHFLV